MWLIVDVTDMHRDWPCRVNDARTVHLYTIPLAKRPTRISDNREDAMRQAAELARSNPGREFALFGAEATVEARSHGALGAVPRWQEVADQ